MAQKVGQYHRQWVNKGSLCLEPVQLLSRCIYLFQSPLRRALLTGRTKYIELNLFATMVVGDEAKADQTA